MTYDTFLFFTITTFNENVIDTDLQIVSNTFGTRRREQMTGFRFPRKQILQHPKQILESVIPC